MKACIFSIIKFTLHYYKISLLFWTSMSPMGNFMLRWSAILVLSDENQVVEFRKVDNIAQRWCQDGEFDNLQVQTDGWSVFFFFFFCVFRR